jgi:ribonuclease Z
MLLDAGPQYFGTVDAVFVTHTHADHVAELPLTLIGNKTVPRIYCPKESITLLTKYVDSMFSTNNNSEISTTEWFQYIGVMPGDEIKYRDYHVNVYKCFHTVPTVCYGFNHITNKIKPEYVSLSGPEIGKLRKSGTKVTYEHVTPKFAFVCDTNITVLEEHPEILKYRTVFIECTFIGSDSNEKDHIHWDQLKPYVLRHPEVMFVLFHFSLKYKDHEIVDYFKTVNLPNATPWV